ncbi:ImpA family type VI secretion system protein [Reyranella sp. CPCC 100927]|uniref:type VI secretion system protein TssA n=1 Tax=Reyranella sp. CPCC 100927 TaxID=2599616 RepID=UPI0011B4C11D|nr:type VI secretion system ImpA family N-terminal domain-containing protein [Reyranella sp. CPCC 100927]TWS95808.1 hypothetical protein FQU96_40045 [Reyranella sp. CPCC 100927]
MKDRPESIDVAALLRPLGKGDGAGVDMRLDDDESSPYRQLRFVRGSARAAERQAEHDGILASDTAIDDWREVKRLCVTCLAEQTKDFEIAAWLTEALVRLDGLTGLASGAMLICELLDQYWHNGFPAESENDPNGWDSHRYKALETMIKRPGLATLPGTIVQPLYLLPLFRLNGGRWVSLNDWRAMEGATSLSGLDSLYGAAMADVDSRQSMAEQVEVALSAWKTLISKVDERFGWMGYDLYPVRETLERIRDVVQERVPC